MATATAISGLESGQPNGPSGAAVI
jgi:hypothetical protein